MKQLSPGSDLVDPKILRGPSIGHNELPDIPNIECPIFKLKMKLRLSSKKNIDQTVINRQNRLQEKL